MAFTNSPATFLLWMGLACVGATAAKKAYDKYKKTNKCEVKNEDNGSSSETNEMDFKEILLRSPVIQWVLAMALPKKVESLAEEHDQSEKSERSDDNDSDNDANDENKNVSSKETVLQNKSFESVSEKGFDLDKQGLEEAPERIVENVEPLHQVPPTDDLSSLVSEKHEEPKTYEEKIEETVTEVELGCGFVGSAPLESETRLGGFEKDEAHSVAIETTEVDGIEIDEKVRDLKVSFQDENESKFSDNELDENLKDENDPDATKLNENAETSYEVFTSNDFESIEPLPLEETGDGEDYKSTREDASVEVKEDNQEVEQNEEEVTNKLEKSLEDAENDQEKIIEKERESLSSEASEFSLVDVEKEIDQDNFQSFDITSDTSLIALPEENEKSKNDSIPEILVPLEADETSAEESNQKNSLPGDDPDDAEASNKSNDDLDQEDEVQNKKLLKSAIEEPHLQDLLQDFLSESSKEAATKPDLDEQEMTDEEESLADKAQNLIKQTVSDICVAVDELVEDSVKKLSPDADVENGESSLKESSAPAKEEVETSEHQQKTLDVQKVEKTEIASLVETKESPLNFFGTISMQVFSTPCQMHVQMMIVHTGSKPDDINSVIEDMDKCNFNLFIKSLENFNLKSKSKIYIKTILSSESGRGKKKMKTPPMKPSTSMDVNKAVEFENVPWKVMKGSFQVSIWTNTTLGGKKKIGNVDIKLGEKLGFGKNKDLTVRELLLKKKGSWIDVSFDFK